MSESKLSASVASPPSAHSSPSSRPTSPNRGLRRPASHGRLAKLMLPGRSRSSSSASASNEIAYADNSTPASSGRTTPEQRRRTGKAAATSLLASDAKYKRFAGQVDKTLQSFESVNEWADFISFLSRLLKTLQTPSPPYAEIPRKLIVSKRLAQCLNPALPSGVHQRALDVYGYIFSTIGVEGLRRDLLIWSSGLFPFFQYAATSVRPLLISLYETYYLPLGDDMRPATKALILALLPALEEETGDFFDRVHSLFGKMSDAVSPAFFKQNILLTLISSPTSRLAALNYLSKSFTKAPETLEDKSDVGLVMRGVAAVLQDENMLVRRTGLDLLLRVLPLDGPIFSESDVKDQELLMKSACAVVLQREVSLSRRVFTWLSSKEESPEKQVAYFRTYGLDLLSRILKEDMDSLARESQLHDAQRPFKVFLSLLDRWEIGASLSDRLVIPALNAIREGLPKLSASLREEMIDTATAVYEAVEPIVIWRTVFGSLNGHASDSSAKLLPVWLVSSIRQRDEEIRSLHAPVILDYLLGSYLNDPGHVSNDWNLASRLLDLISATFFDRCSSVSDGPSTNPTNTDWSDRLYHTPNPVIGDIVQEVRDCLPRKIVVDLFQSCSALVTTRDAIDSSLPTTLGMINVVLDTESPALAKVEGRAWLGKIIKALPKLTDFVVVEGLIITVLKASRCPAFDPKLQISDTSITSTLLDTLLRFLRPGCATYQARAVDLLWECNQLAKPHTLENVVASRLAEPVDRVAAYESFGALWRLTEESFLPGEIFYVPVLRIVDDLGSRDPLSRQRAECWLHLHLQSPFRLIDPILGGLIGSTSDMTIRAYLLETLSSLFGVLSADLWSSLTDTRLAQSVHPQLQQRGNSETTSYLDLLVDVVLANVESEGSTETKRSSMADGVQAAQRVRSSALTLLRRLFKVGQLPRVKTADIHDALVAGLRRSIRQERPALQPQMLALLQLCIDSVALQPQASISHQRQHSKGQSRPRTSSDTETDLALVQVIIEGITSPTNRTLLQPWVEFVIAISPIFAQRQTTILMLSECFADQLRRVMLQLRASYQTESGPIVAETEPVLLLSALQRLISLVFVAGQGSRTSGETSRPQGDGTGSGIMGLVSGVFTVEAPVNDKVSESIQYLDDAVNALLLTWSITGKTYASGPAVSSETQVFARTRARARDVLNHLFQAHAPAVIGSCIQVWAAQSPDIDDEAIFDCIDQLAPSAQKVVNVIADAVNGRPGKGNTETTSDPSILGFLEVYVSRLEAPIAVQIWNAFFSFARDIQSSSSQSSKSQLFPVFRCVTTICKTVSTTSALEDRRLRRDLQDVYLKLLDGVVSNASKSADSARWSRHSPVVDRTADQDSGTILDDGLIALHEFVADQVIPNLRSFLADSDKVAAAAAVIASGLLQPAFRRQRVDGSVLHILLELAKLPSATKSWRLQVGEAFNDQRFFKINMGDAGRWKRLISALMDSDRERFGDLLTRITAAPSANIFTNREQEMISRSLNLRRLSFVLFAAERNHYLAQLPSIQEKLVDILRTDVVSPRVHSEVYLCLRVLMCRISPQHLTNFWPVILTELLKVFEETMDDPPDDGAEGLSLILAACKFLDLLLIIQSEDFQVHQWMFVTDTTDAAYPPEDFLPEAIMDRLSEIMSEHRHTSSTHQPVVLETYDNDSQTLRRPRLTAIRQLSSLYQLQPFFARASIDTFEGVYGNQGVDWDAVESGLDNEILEGQV